jgi:hypothetical protein
MKFERLRLPANATKEHRKVEDKLPELSQAELGAVTGGSVLVKFKDVTQEI